MQVSVPLEYNSRHAKDFRNVIPHAGLLLLNS